MKISKIKEIILELEKDKESISDAALSELFYSLTESSFLDLDLDIGKLMLDNPKQDSYNLIQSEIADLQKRYNDLVFNNRYYKSTNIKNLRRKLEVGDIVVVKSILDRSLLPLGAFKFVGTRAVISDKETINGEELYRLNNSLHLWHSYMFSSVLELSSDREFNITYNFIISGERFAFWYLSNEEVGELLEILGYLRELRLGSDNYLWKSVIKTNLNLLVNAVASSYCKKLVDLDDMPKRTPYHLRDGIRFNEDLFNTQDDPLINEFRDVALEIPKIFSSDELRSEVSNYEFIKLLESHVFYGVTGQYLKKIQDKL